MRFERWWWLYLFCLVSLGIHVGVGLESKRLPFGHLRLTQASGEMEVLLEPEPEAPRPNEPEQPPAAPAKPEPRELTSRDLANQLMVRAPRAARTPRAASAPPVKPDGPAAPKPEPPSPTPEETPKPAGLPTGNRNIVPRPALMAAVSRTDETPRAPLVRSPAPDTGDPMLSGTPGPTLKPRLGGPNLTVDNPLGTTGPSGADPRPALPGGNGKKATPRLDRLARADFPAGGGSPAPGPIPAGVGGFRGPEQPDEGTLFTGGGAGGANLPRATARLGGGGGRSFLSVDNPLARDIVSDDRPGIGPGRGGGFGTGAGGGSGYTTGNGIGNDPSSRYALATLRSAPGTGVGAGSGAGVGTRSPGGGRGTGAELPGTGGTGFGYGKGSGTGIGPGSGVGRGTPGSGGPGRGPGGGRGDGPSLRPGGGGGRLALDRGIPFGELGGLLRGTRDGTGNGGGGPRGTSRGTGAGEPSRRNSSDPAVIVYVLDTSTSMAQGNKIGKAKLALKKALNELRRTDRFNIVNFDGEVHQFGGSLVGATPENMDTAMQYVDAIQLRPGTNVSDAMARALMFRGLTHVFLLSDGEPSRGITNPSALRGLIRDLNGARAKILTLALGLGEQFPGISLLKGIADDNDGDFSYVNLSK